MQQPQWLDVIEDMDIQELESKEETKEQAKQRREAKEAKILEMKEKESQRVQETFKKSILDDAALLKSTLEKIEKITPESKEKFLSAYPVMNKILHDMNEEKLTDKFEDLAEEYIENKDSYWKELGSLKSCAQYFDSICNSPLQNKIGGLDVYKEHNDKFLNLATQKLLDGDAKSLKRIAKELPATYDMGDPRQIIDEIYGKFLPVSKVKNEESITTPAMGVNKPAEAEVAQAKPIAPDASTNRFAARG